MIQQADGESRYPNSHEPDSSGESTLTPMEDDEDDEGSYALRRVSSSHVKRNSALLDAEALRSSPSSSTGEPPVLEVLFDADFVSEDQKRLLQRHLDRILIEQLRPSIEAPRLLSDAILYVSEGASDIVDDSFNRCFIAEPPKAWNWGYLSVVWPFGVLIRYIILFPLRLLLLIISSLLMALIIAVMRMVYNKESQRKERIRKESWLMTKYAQSMMLSWGAVVSYHGVRPRFKANQVYAANHSSMIDYVLLLGIHPFAVVGQLHGGIVGLFQTKVLSTLDCLWFDRKDASDRMIVRQQIQDHVAKEDVAPLVLFPEGTCVANRHTVMFKKGAFELENCEVHPVALKYSAILISNSPCLSWADSFSNDWAVAFWDSRKESFLQYLAGLMASWALVCDIWFLPPTRKRKGETPVQFAQRVKEMISRKAGLVSMPWDGYMKHVRPSERYVQARQKAAAKELLARYEAASANGSSADILSSPRVSMGGVRKRSHPPMLNIK